MKRAWKILNRVVLTFFALVVLLFIAAYFFRPTYPYGWQHRCILQLDLELQGYAKRHGGRFPDGQATPEASLSLLHKEEDNDPGMLTGMTVPEEKVIAILNSGKLLGPDTCGWHYIPGLTLADDPNLAIAWCKEPLGHNAQLTDDGGREVIFVGSHRDYISGKDWNAFLADQKRRLAARNKRAKSGKPLLEAVIEMPDGSRPQTFDGEYELVADGARRGSNLDIKDLRWYQAPIKNGSFGYTLRLGGLNSEVVNVEFTNGEPNVRKIVFKMK